MEGIGALLFFIVVFGFAITRLAMRRADETKAIESVLQGYRNDLGLEQDPEPPDGVKQRFRGMFEGLDVELRLLDVRVGDMAPVVQELEVRLDGHDLDAVTLTAEDKDTREFKLPSASWMVDEKIRLETPDLLGTARCLLDQTILSAVEKLVGDLALELALEDASLVAKRGVQLLSADDAQTALASMKRLLDRLDDRYHSGEKPGGGGRFAGACSDLGLDAIGDPRSCFAARGELDGRPVEVAAGYFTFGPLRRLRFLAELDVDATYREGAFAPDGREVLELRQEVGMTGEDVLAGDDGFDAAWILQGDPDLLRGIFAADGMTEAVETLEDPPCVVKFSTEQIEVIRRTVPDSAAGFRTFVEDASRLAGLLESALRRLT